VVGRQNADIADTLPLREVAMVTTFRLSVWYNFSSMIGRSFWIRTCVVQNCSRRATGDCQAGN